MGQEPFKSLNQVYCLLHLLLDTYTTTLHQAARATPSALMQITLVTTETTCNLHGCNRNLVYVGAAQQHPLGFMKNSGCHMAG